MVMKNTYDQILKVNIGVRPHKEYIRKKGAYEDIYCKFRRTLKYGN